MVRERERERERERGAFVNTINEVNQLAFESNHGLFLFFFFFFFW
jgi:hypothetical protein